MGETANRSELKNVIINSAKDPAGSNIRDKLVEDHGFARNGMEYDGFPVYENRESYLITIQKEIVFAEGIDDSFPESRLIFISKHRSESGTPSLTAHFTGNFGQADLGGKPKEVARFSPSLLKHYIVSLASLRKEIQESYQLTLEATHHGPTSLKNTVLFVELGSSLPQWGDQKAAKSVGSALMMALKAENSFEKCAIAFGGTHYSAKFNKVILETDMALGPIVPKYSLELLDENIMEQLVSKGDQKVTHALLDAKGMSVYKEKVVKLVSEFGLEVVRV